MSASSLSTVGGSSQQPVVRVRIGSRDLFVFTRLVGKFEVLLLTIHLKQSSTKVHVLLVLSKIKNIVGVSLSESKHDTQ